MAAEPLRDYLAAKARLDDVSFELVRAGQLIYRVGQALMKSPPTLVTDEAAGAGLVTLGGQLSMNADDWPTFDKLRNILTEYRETNRRAHDLYERLTPEVRVSVHAPGTHKA